jgi:hypothetical protein
MASSSSTQAKPSRRGSLQAVFSFDEWGVSGVALANGEATTSTQHTADAALHGKMAAAWSLEAAVAAALIAQQESDASLGLPQLVQPNDWPPQRSVIDFRDCLGMLPV